MCGFVGYISNKKYNKNVIKEMNKVIEHRGPDDEDYYVDSNISMAFRRLSIIDLKNGKQPMTNEDNSMVITFNGEIGESYGPRHGIGQRWDVGEADVPAQLEISPHKVVRVRGEPCR